MISSQHPEQSNSATKEVCSLLKEIFLQENDDQVRLPFSILFHDPRGVLWKDGKNDMKCTNAKGPEWTSDMR